MPLSINHPYVSSQPDSANPLLVQASNWNAGHIANGGTQGDLVAYDTTPASHLGTIPAVAAGQVLVSAGVGVLPTFSARPALEGILFPFSAPSSPPDGLVWVEVSGSPPSEVWTIKAQRGGATRILLTINF
jgi:DNA-binding transcriptional LysR family regulator